jgi:hypothetical protein
VLFEHVRKSGYALEAGLARDAPDCGKLAAATTPRSRDPPTATGSPGNSGLSRCSTDA